MAVWGIYLHVYDIWCRIWQVNTVESEGGTHETTGRGCDLVWPAKALRRRAQSEIRCAEPVAGRLCDAVRGIMAASR